MKEGMRNLVVCENCPPESGGQRDHSAISRGGVPKPIVNGSGTTPALRTTPPDSGGESSCPPLQF